MCNDTNSLARIAIKLPSHCIFYRHFPSPFTKTKVTKQIRNFLTKNQLTNPYPNSPANTQDVQLGGAKEGETRKEVERKEGEGGEGEEGEAGKGGKGKEGK